MSKPNSAAKAPQSKGGGSGLFATLAIPILLVVAIVIYMFIFGDPANFVDGNKENHPVEDGVRHFLGLVYKGGAIVPLLFTAFLTTLTFSIERMLTLGAAAGKGKSSDFIKRIQGYLRADQVDQALAECDKQGGSVANVVRSGLHKYKEMDSATGMTIDQRVLSIQKEIEETKSLEMPMLEKNLPILSTIASVGTLVALLGTVLGMIKSFSAMATAGQPDPVKLSTGISEALINTALGIGTSALAIIIYNYLTARIDAMKYNIDEAGFSMTQTFSAKHS